jgi:hypothetical protein
VALGLGLGLADEQIDLFQLAVDLDGLRVEASGELGGRGSPGAAMALGATSRAVRAAAGSVRAAAIRGIAGRAVAARGGAVRWRVDLGRCGGPGIAQTGNLSPPAS